MAISTAVSSLSLNQPSRLGVQKTAVRGLPPLPSRKSLIVVASGGKKLKVDQPFGIGGGMKLRNGVDASGRKPTGKGVYQFVDKYGANVDGYREQKQISECLDQKITNISVFGSEDNIKGVFGILC